jgi:zinc protease
LRYDGAGDAPDAPFRARAPEADVVEDAPDSPPQETRLPNGMRVVLIERHDYPTVAVRLIVDRGSIDLDDVGGSRVGQMSYLYARGGDMAAVEARSAEAARTGVGVSSQLTEDALLWRADGPATELRAMCAALAMYSFLATLSPTEYERREATWLAMVKERPQNLLQIEQNVLFGTAHPYGTLAAPSAGMSMEEAKLLRARLLQPRYATFLVVGDVTSHDLELAVGGSFLAWRGTAQGLEQRHDPPPLRTGASSFAIVRRIGLTQRWANLFARGPSPDSPDFEVMRLVAAMVGGVGGKLYDEVRDEMGAAYGLGAGVRSKRLASWLWLGGAYRGEKVAPALSASLREVARVRAAEVSDDEVEGARQRLLAEWRMHRATSAGTADLYEEAILQGQSFDRVRGFRRRVEQIGRREIARVAGIYLAPERLNAAFLGDDRGFDPRPLGIGNTTMVEIFR